MTLFDESPRLSRDLDAVLVSGARITEATVRQALSSAEAKRVVVRVDRFVTTDGNGIRSPVVVCHLLSGKGEVHLQISINWSSPLLCDTETGTFTIGGRKVSLRVMARRERLAEKTRAFLVRGEDRVAFDLSHYVSRGLPREHWTEMPSLVEAKMRADEDLPAGADLHAIFDQHLEDIGKTWGTRGGLTLITALPTWDAVEPRLLRLRLFISQTKP